MKYMGFDPEHVKPENLIFTVLPIGPPSIRPSV